MRIQLKNLGMKHVPSNVIEKLLRILSFTTQAGEITHTDFGNPPEVKMFKDIKGVGAVVSGNGIENGMPLNYKHVPVDEKAKR